MFEILEEEGEMSGPQGDRGQSGSSLGKFQDHAQEWVLEPGGSWG